MQPRWIHLNFQSSNELMQMLIKQLYVIKVNKTWNKALFKHIVLTIMYWTHIYCISTQLSQFCSFILMKQRTTVSTFTCLYRPSLMQSDWIWSWNGKRHRGYHCLSAQRGWGRPWWHPRTPQSWTRAGERVGKIKLPLRLLQTSMCLLSMRTTTCKTITQSKTNCLMLSEFHFLPNLISYVYNYKFWYTCIAFVV